MRRHHGGFLLLIIIMLVGLGGCASPGVSRPVAGDHFSEIPDIPIPETANDRVQPWIDYFQTRGKERFTRYLERSGKYVPMMLRILKQERLPENLVYLSMIESGFNPHAYSRARAVGAWQFMYQTGARYGLKVNEYVDERRDPEKSTVAAARHLKDLFDHYNDWYLAFAGYNAGEGKINRAIRKYKTEDFWEMSQKGNGYLRPETKNYVPKMIAAAMIAKHPKKYGFDDIQYEDPIEFDVIKIHGQTDLRVLAQCAGVAFEDIRNLNPELLLWVTPDSSYEIKLPKGTADQFQTNYAALESWQKMGEKQHIVQKGEDYESLAKEYKLPSQYLAKVNHVSAKNNLKEGIALTIPMQPPSEYKNALLAYQPVQYYRVRHGDTLGRIASRHGVSVSKIRQWNQGHIGKYIYPGQKITIHSKGSSEWQEIASARPSKKQGRAEAAQASLQKNGGTHTVRSGESLWLIARKYETSIQELKRLNPGEIGRYLRPGAKLRLPSSEGESHVTEAPSKSEVEEKVVKKGLPQKKDDVVYHSVNSGDSLWTISRQYNVSIKDLKKWNEGKIGRYLKTGSVLEMYPPLVTLESPRPASTVNAKINEPLSEPETELIIYKVQSGDTLWDIANKYNVSTGDLKKWNNIQKASRLMPGDDIRIMIQKKSPPSQSEA